ncbi:otefin-like [Culicoides brevitarsis]|uniref:otefin-like n=1 Tax=Culicoides brevitarsis TaxID=469753 RepID=UPI00307BC47F
MTDYDSLSNEELRVELLKYGFANIPVTSTTRKVLVRKLKNHLESEKSKTRRDTFHVTKYSSGEDDDGLVVEVSKKKTTNRRATMAAPEMTVSKRNETNGRASPSRKSVSKIPTAVEEKEATRKSSRRTPQKISTEFDSVEETDEEVQLISDTRRKSKSPSLSKTKVVTTSYKNRAPVIVEAEIDEPLYVPDDDEQDEEDDDYLPLTQKFPASTRKASPARPDVKKRQTIAPTTLESTSYVSPKFNRPSLTASYNYSSPITTSNRRTTLATAPVAVSSQNDDALNDSFDADYTSPYLSDFTRRLSRLKAEPLSQKKPVVAVSRTNKDVYYRTGNIAPRGTSSQSPDTLKGSVREVFRSLSSYKKFFLFVCFLLLVIFVLVMFYF